MEAGLYWKISLAQEYRMKTKINYLQQMETALTWKQK
jgi:hypothetical protein